MSLTADQQATLQLLLERGQTYAELSSLLGVDEDEVRSRARSALGELGGADPDRNVALTDYLLGQADPIGRADVVRHLRDDPDDYRLASDLISELRAAFPSAELPRLPGEPRPSRLPRRQRAAQEAGVEREAKPGAGPLGSLSEGRARLLIALGAGAILLIAVVLAVTGAFGGDDDGDSSATATTATDTTGGNAVGEEITRVPLTAPGGSDAEGQAIFGLATNDQPYVDVSISALDPAPNGQTYVIWLLLTNDDGYPLAPIAVSENGSFQDRFTIPAAVLSFVSRVQFVDVSLADNRELAQLIAEAQRRAQQEDAQVTDLILKKPGQTVLRGEIPAAREGASPGS
jgi:hypothetical protein